jgi:hypothetical protein
MEVMMKKVSIKVQVDGNWSQVFVDATVEVFMSELDQIIKRAVASEPAKIEIYDWEENLIGYFLAAGNKVEYSINQQKLMNCLAA